MKKPAGPDLARKIERAGKALHDEIGPLLSAAGLRLQLLRMDFPETEERVREVTASLDQAIDRIREVSQELKPSPFSQKSGSNSAKREYN
ncbi:MAG TPA: histidine kinase dimerization/phosphoacceptor domain-containing protein [Bryobacteraceae bacterium]|nr:histidine kinase dimerization/phosphoacceptor domain-containing protein [Bryobacteraceae bacterium]